MNHREFLQSLSADQRKQLTEKSDAKGLIRLAQHWGVILLLVVLIINKVRLEALRMLGFYAVFLAVSVVLGTDALLYIWGIPLIIAQPLLRMYLLAEHTGCPHSNNMFSNTRTVYTNAGIRWLAWNMPYHAEHHSYAAVPFYRLPDLHQMVAQYLESTSLGYREYHARYR